MEAEEDLVGDAQEGGDGADEEEEEEEGQCRKYSPKHCSKLQFSIAQIMGFDKVSYSVSVPSARKVIIFWSLVEREREEWEGGRASERRREHGSNLARLETASELTRQLVQFSEYNIDNSLKKITYVCTLSCVMLYLNTLILY